MKMSKWVIGDIHGTYDTMIALIEKVRAKDENAEIIFTGDFVDAAARKSLKSRSSHPAQNSTNTAGRSLIIVFLLIVFIIISFLD